MSAARRYLSRPRTKLYDYNYTMGERNYRSLVDSLDQPRGSRTSDSTTQVTAPSFTKPPPSSTKYRHSADRDLSEDDETIKKIRAARAKMEDEVRSFEESSNARRAARNNSSNNRVDVSERLLDSVGVSRRSTDNSDYEFKGSRSRRAVTELEEDPFFTTKTFKKFQFEDDEEPLPRIKSRTVNSRALAESSEDSFDTAAALARAKKSRARMAEIDDEMEQLAQKSKARGARMASAQAVLKEASEMDSNVSSSTKTVRVSKRSVQVSERVG